MLFSLNVYKTFARIFLNMLLILIPMSKAFAPGNLSCIFRICYNKYPAKMHPLGVGFTTDKGVIAEATKEIKGAT